MALSPTLWCMQLFQNGMSCIIPSSESQALSQIPVVVSTPPLRSWRLTREGLVELSANSPMGAFLDKPRTNKTNTSGEGNVSSYNVKFSTAGRITNSSHNFMTIG